MDTNSKKKLLLKMSDLAEDSYILTLFPFSLLSFVILVELYKENWPHTDVYSWKGEEYFNSLSDNFEYFLTPHQNMTVNNFGCDRLYE